MQIRGKTGVLEKTEDDRKLKKEKRWTVSGQNKIGRELTLLAFIQPTVIKQQAVNNNW